MSLLKLWFIRNSVLVSYSICMRQGSSNLSGSQSALTCLCVCARARLGLREFNNYAVIAPTELTQNYERLNAPHDPNQPIETLFQQIQDARAFAVAGGKP
jgi:hypothetical protein